MSRPFKPRHHSRQLLPHKKRLSIVIITMFLVGAVGVIMTYRSQGLSLPNVVSRTTAIKSGNDSVTQFVIEGSSTDTTVKAKAAGQGSPAKAPPAPPACTPAPTTNLSSLNLSNTDSGLTRQIDSSTNYQLYGYTLDQIKGQAKKCHPKTTEGGDAYFANTAYLINWRFDGILTDDGTCHASNVKVGVRVHQTFPTWNNTPQTVAGVATAWKSFVQNLMNHENGHRDLAISYAGELVHDLEVLSADNCEDLAQAATSTAQRQLAALNVANQSYDDRTHHGATQGAILN